MKAKYLYRVKETRSPEFKKGQEFWTREFDQRCTIITIEDSECREIVLEKVKKEGE